MKTPKSSFTAHNSNHGSTPKLHISNPLPWTPFNRFFALLYSLALLSLFYHHTTSLLLYPTTLASTLITLFLLLADLILAFMWLTAQALRSMPIRHSEFPENIEKVISRKDFPGLDVFICTADPYKEPPMTVVNTALSVLAYDYPTEKLSVYVSDDGGSPLTLFAFMEAAKFAAYWLPFCRETNVVERCPEAFFESNYSSSSATEKIKTLYESMKAKIEEVVAIGKVGDEYVTSDRDRQSFSQWTNDFTPQIHPSVIQVLLECSKDKDVYGQYMPNLIYLSREKNRITPHHFKAGALNVLVRVSGVMTNAPIVLVLDCDMYSNDPQTPLRVLCYYADPTIPAQYAYIQFPQRFKGVNKNDIYAAEFKRLFQIQPMGFDGLRGCNHVGTNCFFFRRAFHGPPSRLISPEIRELSPEHVVDKPIQSREVLALAHKVAGCDFENQTGWGYKKGYRYGSLVEDLFTGYKLQSEGWKAMFCNPERPAFYGDTPINFIDVLNQQKRWAVGVFEMGFSKCTPLIYGVKSVGLLFGIAYSQYAFWTIWCIPVVIYAFIPQLGFLNHVYAFPKVSETWFLLYVFLFIGAYGQDLLDFYTANGTFQMWWSDQRVWNARGLTCLSFGFIEYILKSLGITSHGFNVTSKVVDDDQRKRYDRGIFEFGVHSPMFVTLVMAAIINLFTFVRGLIQVYRGEDLEGVLMQMLLAGFVMVNCLPVYEATFLRTDKGKLPIQTTVIGGLMALVVYEASSVILKH